MKEVSYIQRNPMAPKDAWDSLSIADKAAMMRVAVQNGITNLDDIRAKYNEFAEGGNIYAGGSYMPSEGIKKRISKWEGKAMTGAKDPLSGKFLKNNSFESEAAAFTRAIPESIREQVLSNPELADNLFSYSYNVGAPKFKKRVVKALEDYYAGKGTAKKIADSMWASGDAKLRGLRHRRAEEKKGVMNALRVDVPAMQVQELPVSTTVVNPFILPAENTTFFPQVAPVEDNYVEVQEITPEQRRAEQVRNTFDAINNYNMMMNMLSVPNNPQPMYVPKNAPYVVRGLGGPIVEAAMNEYKKGGGIHIKHPGRLTALKKRTGKTEAELYNDGNPAHKKMVVFARNARKFKHGLGGNLFSGEEEGSQHMITTHKPYYDRDGMLLYNRTLPETIIIPDSQLSPAERNYRERQRQRNLPDYAQHKDRETTARQIANAQKEWENSFEKQALDYGQAIASGVGMGADMVSRLPIYSSLKGASTLSRAETPLDYVESGLWLAPLAGTVGKAAYDAAKPLVSKAANEAAIAWTLRNSEVPEGYLTTKPQVRTRVGDVEIDNPNLLYHLDRGDGAGAFSTQGAYIEDDFLLPGTPKDAASVPYSWWNKGKPYATSVNGQPMTRLMTATEDTPGMLNVRSQNYPIGQWNGKRGFVLPSEYVSSKPVDVSNNTYNWIEGYGWKKNIPDFLYLKMGEL